MSSVRAEGERMSEVVQHNPVESSAADPPPSRVWHDLQTLLIAGEEVKAQALQRRLYALLHRSRHERPVHLYDPTFVESVQPNRCQVAGPQGRAPDGGRPLSDHYFGLHGQPLRYRFR